MQSPKKIIKTAKDEPKMKGGWKTYQVDNWLGSKQLKSIQYLDISSFPFS
jgi:hypothetical protein